MKIKKIKLEIDAISENEAFARSVISLFASKADPDIETLAEVRTAISEAVTNCIVHAYKNTFGRIYITASLAENSTLTVKIRDKGCGIEDVDKARTPLFTTDTSGERGGMGFAVMESFCDKISVSSKINGGTTVTLVKKLNNEK